MLSSAQFCNACPTAAPRPRLCRRAHSSPTLRPRRRCASTTSSAPPTRRRPRDSGPSCRRSAPWRACSTRTSCGTWEPPRGTPGRFQGAGGAAVAAEGKGRFPRGTQRTESLDPSIVSNPSVAYVVFRFVPLCASGESVPTTQWVVPEEVGRQAWISCKAVAMASRVGEKSQNVLKCLARMSANNKRQSDRTSPSD